MRLQSPASDTSGYLAQSDRIAAVMPDLLVSAERAAATLSQGMHGRRSAGRGETFWQYRRYAEGDSAANIDWRRSGRSDHHFIRENEWEAAHTVWFWADMSASMHVRSKLAEHTKAEQAILIALSTGFLLTGAGERVGAWGSGLAPGQSRRSVENLASAILDMHAAAEEPDHDLPPLPVNVRPYAEIVLLSDFMTPLEALQARLKALSAEGLRGHLVQILDPVEEEFPFTGRIVFEDPQNNSELTVNRAEMIREDYRARLLDHRAELAQMARKMSWSLALHHTSQPAAQAVLQLHNALAPEKP